MTPDRIAFVLIAYLFAIILIRFMGGLDKGAKQYLTIVFSLAVGIAVLMGQGIWLAVVPCAAHMFKFGRERRQM